MLKNNISNAYSPKHIKIKIDSNYDLPLEKTNMHYVVILIKSVINKNHNHRYYQEFLEKRLYT